MRGSLSSDFGPFEGNVWLDCAHQGPLPRVAAREARRELARKVRPWAIDDDSFHEVPDRLRRVLGRLVGAPPGEIVLGDSTSYGLHLLADGFPWRRGDEILLPWGDFPATVLPWLRLQERGVRIRFLEPRGGSGVPGAASPSPLRPASPSRPRPGARPAPRHSPPALPPAPGEVEAAITPRTRLLCASWVNSFTGGVLDLQGVGAVCRERGVAFVVNGSQGVGSLALDVGTLPVDALACCGFKWLCGPYGTGFLWLRRRLLERLACNRAYWLPRQRGRTLDDMRDPGLVRDGDLIRDAVPGDLGAARFDVFGTANFLNFVPWTRALEYLLEVGIDRIVAWNSGLVDRLAEGLLDAGFDLASPRSGPGRSCLVVFSHRDADRNETLVRRLAEARIHVSLREGKIRVSPHLYNTQTEVERLLEALGRGG